jgi:hypothetical protein
MNYTSLDLKIDRNFVSQSEAIDRSKFCKAGAEDRQSTKSNGLHHELLHQKTETLEALVSELKKK